MSTLVSMQQRRDTYANWQTINPVLKDGEIGIITDQLPNELWLIIGDGNTAAADLTIYKLKSNSTSQTVQNLTVTGTLTLPLGSTLVKTANNGGEVVLADTETVINNVALLDSQLDVGMTINNVHILTPKQELSLSKVQNITFKYDNNDTTTASIAADGSGGLSVSGTGVSQPATTITGATTIDGKITGYGGAQVYGNTYAYASGTTANRPTSAQPGTQYFDTTLGKPIWVQSSDSSSGTVTAWVDATGATV